jgi:hypothetical protein
MRLSKKPDKEKTGVSYASSHRRTMLSGALMNLRITSVHAARAWIDSFLLDAGTC